VTPSWCYETIVNCRIFIFYYGKPRRRWENNIDLMAVDFKGGRWMMGFHITVT
jgi:hypothetical protein